MKVAFVGLGIIGGPQARLIAKSGFDLAVYDAFPAALEGFRDVARLAPSAADAAQGADVACVCVRDDAQVNEVVLGAKGLAAGLAPGALLLIHSTVHMETLQGLEAALSPLGIALVDAPITRTRPTDDVPFVLTMLGGQDAAVARARPVVKAFSTDIEAVGKLGSAMALKISNNLVAWLELVVGMQAVSLSAHFSVPYEKLRTVMKANGNLTPSMEKLLDMHQNIAPRSNAQFDAIMANQGGIGEKDLALAVACGEAAGLDMGMAAAAQAIVRSAMLRQAVQAG